MKLKSAKKIFESENYAEVFQSSTYSGDEIYSIVATGDVVSGDEISFELTTSPGGYLKFATFELIQCKVLSDSYVKLGVDGKEMRDAHFFTVELNDGSIRKIKARSIYSNGVFRKPWLCEVNRRMVADEKHQRGLDVMLKYRRESVGRQHRSKSVTI